MVSKLLALTTGYLLLLAITIIVVSAAVVVLVLGPKITGFEQVSAEQFSVASLSANPELISEARRELGDQVLSALDCSSFTPAERRPGQNCLPGLLASLNSTKSPIPEKALFMVPIWKAAAERYQLPWQLLAAVAGARSNFSTINCPGGQGTGMYRIYPQIWDKYRVDGGSMVVKKRGLNCREVIAPGVNSNKRQRQKLKPKIFDRQPLSTLPGPRQNNSAADPYDPVDATFTVANFLAQGGAFRQSPWKYSGSPPQQCTTAESDGPIWYPPQLDFGYGPGARIGYNGRLDIPRSIALLAAKYRSDKGKYRPRRDPDNNRSPMPKKDIVKILTAAWSAFGARGQDLRNKVTLNYAQVSRESGGRPYIMQGYIGDVNDNNPAGGLMQFIISTFKHWKVDGFDDRFNPLDNILAAVNAQVNGPYPILDGSSGWSPPFSKNPYARGGRSRLVGDQESSAKKIAQRPYRGASQVDPVSRSLRPQRPGYPNSDCYIAVVHSWYRAIVENPPQEPMIVGPLRTRIVKIAQAELQKKVAESGGDNVPRYQRSSEIAPYNIGTAWCQSFASWIWYQAGIKNITKLGGMTQTSGLTMPAYTGAVSAAAQSRAIGMSYKTKNPLPGDLMMYSDRHVEIVEKVKNGKVLSTIGGNTSDAVTRATAPSGYTHFISPPKKAGPSTYNLQDGAPGVQQRWQKKLDKLDLKAGIVDNRGKKTIGAGAIISAPAGETIDLALLAAAQGRVGAKQLRRMLLTPGPLSRRPVLDQLGDKAPKLLQSAMRPATGVALRPRDEYGATIWPGAGANQQAIKLAGDKRQRKLLNNLGLKQGPWKYRLASVSTGREYQRRWLFRAVYFNERQARTIIIASNSYRQGQRAINLLSRWR